METAVIVVSANALGHCWPRGYSYNALRLGQCPWSNQKRYYRCPHRIKKYNLPIGGTKKSFRVIGVAI